MCVQEEETIQHIMVSCVFSREIWYQVLSLVGLQQCLPRPSDTVFQEWWQASELQVPKQHGKGFNSLVALVVWWLWKHRDACVFEASHNAQKIIQYIEDDARLWCMAGAKGLSGMCHRCQVMWSLFVIR
jgi:hypothetical protein